jgi:hypothetical protein
MKKKKGEKYLMGQSHETGLIYPSFYKKANKKLF